MQKWSTELQLRFTSFQNKCIADAKHEKYVYYGVKSIRVSASTRPSYHFNCTYTFVSYVSERTNDLYPVHKIVREPNPVLRPTCVSSVTQMEFKISLP